MHKTAMRIVLVPLRVAFLLSFGNIPLDRLEDLALVLVITLCVGALLF
jgi:hypothetical protein